MGGAGAADIVEAQRKPQDRRLVRGVFGAEDSFMREPRPYLREAVVAIIPTLTDEQLERIGTELEIMANPYLLVSRLSEHSVLIQGIPVHARSPHDADAVTWETIYGLVRSALTSPWDWDTRITAIDVRESDGALAS